MIQPSTSFLFEQPGKFVLVIIASVAADVTMEIEVWFHDGEIPILSLCKIRQAIST